MKLRITQCKIKKFIMLNLFIFAWHSLSAIAGKPIFDISTTTKSIDVPVNTSAYVVYSIYNNTPNDFKPSRHGGMSYTPTNATVAEGTTCGDSLAAHASCTLLLRLNNAAVGSTYQLNITACYASTFCSQANTDNRTNVRIINSPPPPPPPPPPPAPLPFIAAGTYVDVNNNQWPLLALSTDNVNTWTFPSSVTQPKLTPDYFSDRDLSSTLVNAALCTDQAEICILVGRYTDAQDMMRPLLATSTDKGSSWIYSSSLSQPSVTPAFASNGTLESASCNSTGSICVANGTYNIHNTQYPLLAYSINGGNTWLYPDSIQSSLQPLDFFGQGIFHSSSCADNSLCIATGEYIDSHDIHRPLLAKSNDNGKTWSYSSTVTQPSTTPLFSNKGVFNSAHCSKEGKICVAVGSYVDTDGILRPLLAQSTDNGTSWNYPANISQPSVPLFYIGMLNAVHCNGSSCIAVGSYVDTDAIQRPLLAFSQDAGGTWTYSNPISQPNTVPEFSNKGTLYGVNCDTEGVCIATGKYTDKNNIQRPLLTLSLDSGNNWSYSSAVSQPATTPAFADQGLLGTPHCRGNGSTAICIASGSYQDSNGMIRPLIASTNDGGNSWTFPSSVTQPDTTPAYANQGNLYRPRVDESQLQCHKTVNSKPTCQTKDEK